jgi:hypothetical protein
LPLIVKTIGMGQRRLSRTRGIATKRRQHVATRRQTLL